MALRNSTTKTNVFNKYKLSFFAEAENCKTGM